MTDAANTPVAGARDRTDSPPAAPRPCPACGRLNDRAPAAVWSSPPWRIKTCTECRFVYLENPPDYSALEEEFAWEKTSVALRAERRRQEPLLHFFGAGLISLKNVIERRRGGGKVFRLINQFMPRGRVLDLGCGGGDIFDSLPQTVIPFGIEISCQQAVWADARAKQRGGYVIQAAVTEGLGRFADAFFDGVVMRSYLEHEVEPAAVLRGTLRVLRPGGTVIVKVPNFGSWNRRVRGTRWCGFRHPDHVNYFTPRSLRGMIEGAGFEVARFSFGDHPPTSDSMWMVIRRGVKKQGGLAA